MAKNHIFACIAKWKTDVIVSNVVFLLPICRKLNRNINVWKMLLNIQMFLFPQTFSILVSIFLYHFHLHVHLFDISTHFERCFVQENSSAVLESIIHLLLYVNALTVHVWNQYSIHVIECWNSSYCSLFFLSVRRIDLISEEP